jgi:hypothetical protein
MVGLGLVFAHMVNCRTSRDEGGKGLLNPQITLTVGDQDVVLKLTGPKSKNPNKVSVASSHRYGEGVFYGYIDADGNFSSRRGLPVAVISILERIAQNPAQGIAEIGRESGRCCYCRIQLTTVQSKIAGYGKRCQMNYGGWYPTTDETRTFLMDHPEILDGASDADRWVSLVG